MKFFGDESDRSSWAKHYVAVKSKIKQPKKDSKVKVKTKSGGTYSYKYAPLVNVDKAIIDACKEVTDKDGKPAFSYLIDADVDENGVLAKTVMIDSSGFMAVTSPVWFKNFNSGDAQKTASLITYAKRYSLSAAFGIASDDDDDANSLNRPQPQQIKRLNLTELNNYEVDFNGAPTKLIDVWNLAKDGEKDAHDWIVSAHDAQTNAAIKQLIDKANLEERIEKAKKRREARKIQKTAPKPEKQDEVQDTIKQVEQAKKQEKSSNNGSGGSGSTFTAESLF